MATSFTWNVAQMQRQTADGAVTVVHYTVDAFDGTSYRAGAYGSVALEQPDPDTMIPYADLTPEVVLNWVKSKLGEEQVQSICEALQKQLDEQRQPTMADGLPWVAA